MQIPIGRPVEAISAVRIRKLGFSLWSALLFNDQPVRGS
jgi:hypothetical protein